MKEISTVATKQMRDFRGQNLMIGLDLRDRSSWYCVLDAAGEVLLEQKLGTTAKCHERGVRGNTAEPDRVGNGDAFALGEPVIERVGARSNRGACPQRALDRGKPPER